MTRRPISWLVAIALSLIVSSLLMSTATPPGLAAPVNTLSPAETLVPPTEQTELDGKHLFEIHCAGCHARGGNIIRRGKNLKLRSLQRNQMDSVESIIQIVTYGKRPMSAYEDKLTGKEIQAVSAYVLEQAEQGWK